MSNNDIIIFTKNLQFICRVSLIRDLVVMKG